MSARNKDPFGRDDELEDEFETRVRRQRARIEKGRREKGQSFWQYVGLFGAVGWSVVIPLVLGGVVGRWIDLRYETGHFWSLSLLLLGLVVGALNGWRVVNKDMK